MVLDAPRSSMNPTEAARPSCTYKHRRHSHGGACASPGGEGGGSHDPSRRCSDRSCPRRSPGRSVHLGDTMARWTSAASACCSSCPASGRCTRSPTRSGRRRRACRRGSPRWPATSAARCSSPTAGGRGDRAGRRLADHAVTILAAVEAARLDLDPTAEPAGVARVAGFASLIRRSLLPAIDDLRSTHPRIEVRIHEDEPLNCSTCWPAMTSTSLSSTTTTSPRRSGDDHVVSPLWDLEWGIGVPTADRHLDLADLADRDWIVKLAPHRGRGRAAHAGLAGRLRAARRAPDRLARVVDDLVVAGRGVASCRGGGRRGAA